jgi:predicted O-methyltransferase YrrM
LTFIDAFAIPVATYEYVQSPGAEEPRMLDQLPSDLRGQILEAVAAAVEETNRQQNELLERMVETIRRDLRNFEYRTKNCLVYAAERQSSESSARFMLEHLSGAQPFPHPVATLDYALRSAADEPGMALEFGVYTGGSLRIIAAARDGQEVYGFDAFEGLPENWRPGFDAGHFALTGDAATMIDVPGATLVKGWFDTSLPEFLASHPGPAAFVHIDCDLYSSARIVLSLLRPRLVPGTVIVFDEFFNYPGWEQHEYRAWTEFVDETGIAFEYLAYAADGWNVAVQVTK